MPALAIQPERLAEAIDETNARRRWWECLYYDYLTQPRVYEEATITDEMLWNGKSEAA